MLNSIFKGNSVSGVHQLQNVEYPFAHSIQQQHMLLASEPQPLSFVNITPDSHFFLSRSESMIEPAPEPSSSQLHNLSVERDQKLLEVVQVTESNKHEDKKNLKSIEKDKQNWKDNNLKLSNFVAKLHNIAGKFKIGTTGKISKNCKNLKN